MSTNDRQSETAKCEPPSCDPGGAALCEAHCPHFEHVVRERDDEIERLRVVLNHIAENVCRQPKEATKMFALRELS